MEPLTNLPQETPVATVPSRISTNHRGIIVVVVVLAIAIIGGLWYLGQVRAQNQRAQNAAAAQQLNSSLTAITATTSTSIPTTSNSLKSATPAVNPVAKTNPFNHAYQNPFQ